MPFYSHWIKSCTNLDHVAKQTIAVSFYLERLILIYRLRLPNGFASFEFLSNALFLNILENSSHKAWVIKPVMQLRNVGMVCARMNTYSRKSEFNICY